MKRGTTRRIDDGRAPLPAEEIPRYAEVLKALGSTARLAIINRLAARESTVSELCELTGLKQSLVSQQLKILRLSGVVQGRKGSHHTYYRLRDRSVVRMLSCLGRCSSMQSAVESRSE